MKKTIASSIAIVLLLAAGTAFAEDRGSAREARSLYNGITYFDKGPASTVGEPAVKNESKKMLNGITAFDWGQPGTVCRKSPDEQLAKETAAKSYNGITFF